MEESLTREAYSHSSGQEIIRLLWNPKVQYHVHKSPQLVPILIQIHPIHTFPLYFSKVHPIIILPSALRSSEWSLPFRFSDHFVFISHLSHTCCMLRPSHPPLFDHPNNICEAYKLRNFSLCNLLQPPSTFSLLGPIFSSAPCSQTPSNYVLP